MEKIKKTKEFNLTEKMAELDHEFKDFMQGLKFVKVYDDDRLQTYSPLEAVSDFEQRGIQKIREVNSDEMMNNEDGMRKLLANMLNHCRPGLLDQEDMEQLSGINGREARGSV